MIFIFKYHRFHICLLFIFLFSHILTSTQAQASLNSMSLTLEFLDDRLSLSAEKAPLKTILTKIQENTKLEYEIPENLLELLISVSFQSLSLEKGIQRILRSFNYSCIFNQDGELMKVIILSKTEKSIESFSDKKALYEKLPVEKIFKTVPAPTPEDLVVAMSTGDFMPPREIENYLKVMKTVSASEAQDMMKHIRITPMEQEEQDYGWETEPPLELFQRIVKNMPEE